MKRLLVVLALVVWLQAPVPAEAGVRTWWKNSVVYLYRPIPALYNYAGNLLGCVLGSTITFTSEVVGNFNANPANGMQPIFPDPIPQPDPVPQPTE